ncbi:hypothetical protein Ocin01_19509 [Orchesella cincta]|uniref:Uncharacterized protein n=1 Tax=Orchesella cincta TaxID=48709 RepID=A0A1D2M2H1_ORCCI|nr:hypothetical protein Ocin01_19509 [Orchesella cincta]
MAPYRVKHQRKAASVKAVESRRLRMENVIDVTIPEDDLTLVSETPATKPTLDHPTNHSKTSDENNAFTGRRVISCSSMDECVEKISLHCHEGMHFKRSREVKYGGLFREIYYQCKCGYEVMFSSDCGNENLPINEAVSDAAIITPLGYEALTTLLTTLDLPSPSPTFFSKSLNTSREKINTYVEKQLLQAGKEEKRLAEEADDFVTINGVKYPWVLVIVDGGWPKRSYGHTYDSPCGVAVIIGARTGKVLYFGTRTKTCVVCNTASNKGLQPKDHTCYKNWNKASTAMEQDILLDGFKQSLQVHGIAYLQFVGDGDSSVHSAVVDVYEGHKVEKIDCYNHVTKNLNKKLHAIAAGAVKGKNAPKIPKEERQLPRMEEFFSRIGSGVHAAIVHHSEFAKEKGRSVQLFEDIANVPQHVFGDHSKCRDYFCDPAGDRRKEKNLVPFMSNMALWDPLKKAVAFVANLAPGLIHKRNTNWAESFMSVANKFVAGKRIHLGGSFLYGLRMSSAVLSYNLSPYWLPDLYEDINGIAPSRMWLKLKERGIKRRLKGCKRKERRKKWSKFGFLKSRKGDNFYGSEPTTVELTSEQLELAIEELYKNLQVDEAKCSLIELKTRDQSESNDWYKERLSRLTASVAGKLSKLRPTSDNTATLNYLLKSDGFRGTVATEYGKESEGIAISAYEIYKDFPVGFVQKVGLIVSKENGIYGASSDGLVGTDGLLEVKCPYCIRDKLPEDWPASSKDSPLVFKNGTLSLKPAIITIIRW